MQALFRSSIALTACAVAVGVGLFAGGCQVDDRNVAVGAIRGDAGPSSSCGGSCPEVVCPPDDACKDYAERIPAGSCGSAGACASAADCAFDWKAEARNGAACACGAGGCKLLAGGACSRPGQCQSGTCVATDEGGNVCCAAACGPAEVCSPDGSACVAASPCSDGSRRCSGAVHQQCSESTWQTLTDCGELGCSNERGGCLRSAGQACESSADCGAGSCAATAEGTRVCCTAGCAGACQRCAASGTACEDAPDDEACGVIDCPADDACRTYDPPSVISNRCRQGRCATPAEVCSTFQPAKADLACSPTALCDDQGNCSRAKKSLSQPCGSGAECASGACVANASGSSVCCSEGCAPNQICNAAGACELAPTCSDDATQCSGTNFQRCNAGQWRTALECGALGCSVARGGCLGAAGDGCSSDADCGAGSCEASSGGASICCTAACAGACRRCAPSGTACENLPDDAACGVISCPADTTCRDYPASVSSNRCIGGRCGSDTQLCTGTARGAGQVCSSGNLCDTAGNCSAPKHGVGDACSNGNECALGNCVAGVCCNSACDGLCSTCAGTGICRAPAQDSRCGTGLCASVGVCQAASVACGTESCPIVGAVCCSELSAAGGTRLFCANGSEDCPAQPAFIPDIPINCDQHTDCPSNRVCCMAGTSTSTEVSCKLPQPSPGTDETSIDFDSCAPLNPMLFGNQLCLSPQGSFPCPAFESCTSTNERLPGFAFCRPD